MTAIQVHKIEQSNMSKLGQWDEFTPDTGKKGCIVEATIKP